jgi:V-type H+-transporting ATPase subunit a
MCFSLGQPLLPTDPESNYQVDKELSFSNIAGVIPTADRIRFERMLFRSTRGNCYVRFADIEEPLVNTASGTEVSKSVFLILYKSSAIEGKVKRICDAFSAHRFDLPNLDRRRDVENQMQSNQRELEDSKRVLDKNTESRVRLCVELAQNVEEWLWVVRREKAIYHTLNLFKNDAGNFLRGQGWILKDSLIKARAALDHAQSSLNLPTTSVIEKVHDVWPTPPTHFRTNKFTDAYQEFVNTYGIPRYREANPALFTAATFPFLFGVMYGDIGHGSLMALAGAVLIATEKYGESRDAGEMMKGVYSARYMLFMMGIMGLYAGLIYNDFFSLGLNLFGSSWEFKVREQGEEAENKGEYGDPAHVYPFGVDPAWHISDNELLFFNSMKMKMSVILGIIQMTFGVCLRGLNAVYFRQYLELFTEFLPMIIFCVGFFGYMIILIFVKWSIDWDARMLLGSCVYTEGGDVGCSLEENEFCYSYEGEQCDKSTLVEDLCPLDYGGSGDGCQPPNLITTLINIALSPGAVEEPMYEGQVGVQTALLLIAFFCVPWLLLGKPLYLRYFSKKSDLHEVDAAQAQNPLLDNVSTHKSEHGDSGHGGAAGGDHGHEDFGEIAIHQAIETIEFVLGMVSNTASYLRLWALSLAHSELATVFWEKAMVSMIATNNPVMVYFGYAVFAAVTIAVLLMMDVLECFLHALRLHWVEFQNKFFKADGYRFVPFDFKNVLQRAILE